MLKRAYDILFAATGLIILSPLFILIALAVLAAGGRPIFFQQVRTGFRGREFRILKFRTMVPNAPALGAAVTSGADPRITRIGSILRRLKLDELPQLWNVFRGEMSLVGPRPEVPSYVALYTESQKAVLNLKPGITDLASIVYRREEELLSSAADVHSAYLQCVMPHKLSLSLQCARCANCWEDTKVILRTLFPFIPLRLRAEAAGGCTPTPVSNQPVYVGNKN